MPTMIVIEVKECRIDDDGVYGPPRRLDQVDQFAVVVRLAKGRRQPQPPGGLFASFLDLGQGGRVIDVRVAYAEQIELRSSKNAQVR